MSIRIVADNFVQPDKTVEYLVMAKEIVEKTNVLDKGCIAYNLFRDKSDPAHFVMLEEWDTQESLEAHMRSVHFLALIPRMNALASKPGGIGVYENAF